MMRGRLKRVEDVGYGREGRSEEERDEEGK